MGNFHSNAYDLYKDIQVRCGGEIYIGVVGPVRTGKSTFIKRFMDLLVLPFMEDENARERACRCAPRAVGANVSRCMLENLLKRSTFVTNLRSNYKEI